MADRTVVISAAQVPLIRDSLLHEYAVRAEALHHAVHRLLDAPAAVQEVDGLRVEMRDLEDALDQVGWRVACPGEVELTSHPEVLSDAAHDALCVALGHLQKTCNEYRRRSDVRERGLLEADVVRGLVALVAEVDDG